MASTLEFGLCKELLVNNYYVREKYSLAPSTL